MERIKLEHPLPKEILDMDKDDTVCKFCGVSYLIHNEIKMLEVKVQKMEEELRYLESSKEREDMLRSEVKHLKTEISNFQVQLKQRDVETEQLRKSEASYCKELAELKINLATYLDEITSLKAAEMTLRKSIFDLSSKCCMVHEAVKVVSKMLLAIQFEFAQFTNEFQNKLVEMKKRTDVYITNSMTQQEKIVIDLNEKNRILYEENAHLERRHADLRILEDDFINLKIQFENEIVKSKALKTNIEEEKNRSDVLLQECEQLKKMILTKEDQADIVLKNRMETELVLQSKISTLQNALDEEGARFQSFKKELEVCHLNEKQLLQKEVEFENRQRFSRQQFLDLQQRYNSLQSEMTLLRDEKENLIQSHHSRIEQLKESFKLRADESDKWPAKLEQTIQAERKKHATELEAIEKSLKENFILEMKIEQEKNSGLYHKYQGDARIAEERLRKQFAEDLSGAQNEIVMLKKNLFQMEARAQAAQDNDSCDFLRNQLIERERALADARENETRAERLREEAARQILLLQETVRRECEERFELTEALELAKHELLTFKRPPNGYNASNQTQRQQQLIRESSNSSSVTLRLTSRNSTNSPNSGVSSFPVVMNGRESILTDESKSKRTAYDETNLLLNKAANISGGGSIVQTKRRLAALMAASRQIKK